MSPALTRIVQSHGFVCLFKTFLYLHFLTCHHIQLNRFFPYFYFNVVTVVMLVSLFCFSIILQGDHVCTKQITGQKDSGKSVTPDQALYCPAIEISLILQSFQRKSFSSIQQQCLIKQTFQSRYCVTRIFNIGKLTLLFLF